MSRSSRCTRSGVPRLLPVKTSGHHLPHLAPSRASGLRATSRTLPNRQTDRIPAAGRPGTQNTAGTTRPLQPAESSATHATLADHPSPPRPPPPPHPHPHPPSPAPYSRTRLEQPPHQIPQGPIPAHQRRPRSHPRGSSTHPSNCCGARSFANRVRLPGAGRKKATRAEPDGIQRSTPIYRRPLSIPPFA
jgi:hypothetical protein